jgi:DNA repair exonuclease SbcCD ATPase subunit
MKLASVTVRAFRGFGREFRFDLGDTNVFAGPNGFGKTSFFDAVQWCLFGEVPRLSGSRDFSRAGDVLQNKFSAEPYFVAVEFESDRGERLSRKRTVNSCTSQLNGQTVTDRVFLEQLGLETDGQDRFLRYFMLQQEKVNEFVRDLNPRGRYDSMIALLQFSTPDRLSSRLNSLRDELEAAARQTNNQLREIESRLSVVQLDIKSLTETTSELSEEVIKRAYESFLASSAKVRHALGLKDRPDSTGALSQLPEYAERLDAALRELRNLKSTAAHVANLKEQIAAAPADIPQRVNVLSEQIEDLQKQHLKLQMLTDEVAKRLASVEREVETQRHSIQRFHSVLAEVKALIDSDICPVCKRPIKRRDLLAIIDSEIGRESQQVSGLISQRNNLQGELAQIQAKGNAIASGLEAKTAERRSLQSYSDKVKQFEAQWDSLRHARIFNSLAIPADSFEKLIAASQATEAEVEGLHRQALDLIQLAQRLESANKILPARNAEFARLEVARSTSLKAQQSWTIVEDMFKRCTAAISNTRTNLVTEMLDLNKPLIRNLYSRLHPHPLFSEIDFEVVRAYKEAELYFRVLSRDHSVVGYPSTIFSGSQLNALAVCIFVALSLRSAGTLKFLLLDDPIQSMDDINVLGFCDVLRQLKRTRQLFVSTHSRNFYRLLLSKLRPASSNDRVRGFRFEGWSNDGPQITEEDGEFVDVRVPLGDMSSIIAAPA